MLGKNLTCNGFIIPQLDEYISMYSPLFFITKFLYSSSASNIKTLLPLLISFTIIFFNVKLFPPPVDAITAKLLDGLVESLWNISNIQGSAV